MNITFYNFTKRLNSTKVVASTGTQATVVLKETSSLTRPIIRLQSASRPTYNYAYIGDFGRYYYVHEWTWRDGLWEVELEIDALASWKTAIGNWSTYVLRSSHSSDLYIRDSFYPAKCKTVLNQQSLGAVLDRTGGYVLSIISNAGDSSAVGGSSTYFRVSKDNIDNLITALLTDMNNAIDPGVIGQAMSSLAKSIANPLQWIQGCIWLPIPPGITIPKPINLGLWNTNIMGGVVIAETTENLVGTVTLPDHPQISRGKWLNADPFRKMKLNAGPYGSIEIPGDAALDSSTLTLKIIQDNLTGASTLNIKCGSGTDAWTCNAHAQIGVTVGLSQIMTSQHEWINATTGIAGGVMKTFSIGSAVMGTQANAIGEALNGIVDFAECIQGTPSSSGQDGAMNAMKENWTLDTIFTEIVDEDNARLGRPLCQSKTLSTIPGFIQVAEGDVDCEATLAEKATIKSYLEGGFYYE